MGDVIHLPARPEVVERYVAVKTYGEFGRMSVTLTRSTMVELTHLALCLDGLHEGVGFEILGRVHDSPEGIALADHKAMPSRLYRFTPSIAWISLLLCTSNKLIRRNIYLNPAHEPQ